MPFQVTQRSIKDMINDAKIKIPEHQRPYMWKPKQANAFLVTIMDNMPTLNLILYEEIVNGKLVRWLEDGQQRFMTVKKFYEGLFDDSVKWNNKKFDEFSPEEKTRFENYPFVVTTVEDVPYERRVALFQAIQEGSPLTTGQRFHASSHSELVILAKNIMKNAECISVWGSPKSDDKDLKKKDLSNAVAIVCGLAFQTGETSTTTTSYDIIGAAGYLTTPINHEQVNERLTKLLSVYRRADELYPVTPAKKKQQFDAGKYTGYILYAMCLPDRNWEADKEMFAQFIACVREKKDIMKILTWKKPATRNWNTARWTQGLWNLEHRDYVIDRLKEEGELSDTGDESDE